MMLDRALLLLSNATISALRASFTIKGPADGLDIYVKKSYFCLLYIVILLIPYPIIIPTSGPNMYTHHTPLQDCAGIHAAKYLSGLCVVAPMYGNTIAEVIPMTEPIVYGRLRLG